MPVNTIHLGSGQPSTFYIGSDPVTEIYLGTNLVFGP